MARKAATGLGMDGPFLRPRFRDWTALVIEVSVFVGAAHQHGRDARRRRAAGISRDIADAETDAPVVRAVGPRIVHQVRVVQRELAGLHRHEVGARAIDGDRRASGRATGGFSGSCMSAWRILAELVRAGTTSMQPASIEASVSATQAVTWQIGSRRSRSRPVPAHDRRRLRRPWATL
jgi:hypothetical protein